MYDDVDRMHKTDGSDTEVDQSLPERSHSQTSNEEGRLDNAYISDTEVIQSLPKRSHSRMLPPTSTDMTRTLHLRRSASASEQTWTS